MAPHSLQYADMKIGRLRKYFDDVDIESAEFPDPRLLDVLYMSSFDIPPIENITKTYSKINVEMNRTT